MNLKWVKGATLDIQELRKVVIIDNTIPKKFDPTWIADELALNERIVAFQKLTDADFFEVVYDASAIVAFHMIRGKLPIAHIWTLWVHPEYRGKKLAKGLKEKGLKWAKDKGYSFIQTAVNTANTRMGEINLSTGYEPFSTIYRLKL